MRADDLRGVEALVLGAAVAWADAHVALAGAASRVQRGDTSEAARAALDAAQRGAAWAASQLDTCVRMYQESLRAAEVEDG